MKTEWRKLSRCEIKHLWTLDSDSYVRARCGIIRHRLRLKKRDNSLPRCATCLSRSKGNYCPTTEIEE